jgi:hypothetical protein
MSESYLVQKIKKDSGPAVTEDPSLLTPTFSMSNLSNASSLLPVPFGEDADFRYYLIGSGGVYIHKINKITNQEVAMYTRLDNSSPDGLGQNTHTAFFRNDAVVIRHKYFRSDGGLVENQFVEQFFWLNNFSFRAQHGTSTPYVSYMFMTPPIAIFNQHIVGVEAGGGDGTTLRYIRSVNAYSGSITGNLVYNSAFVNSSITNPIAFTMHENNIIVQNPFSNNSANSSFWFVKQAVSLFNIYNDLNLSAAAPSFWQFSPGEFFTNSGILQKISFSGVNTVTVTNGTNYGLSGLAFLTKDNNGDLYVRGNQTVGNQQVVLIKKINKTTLQETNTSVPITRLGPTFRQIPFANFPLSFGSDEVRREVTTFQNGGSYINIDDVKYYKK